MKLASVVSAVITSLAPMAFAQDVDKDPGRGLPVEEYHYGMQLDVKMSCTVPTIRPGPA